MTHVRRLIARSQIGSTLAAVSAVTLMVAGCASAPVKPTYVSSAVYKDYTCAQLEQEYRRVNEHVRTTSTERKGFDMTGIGVGITAGRGGVYPSVSVGMGRGSDSSNPRLSRLLGERDAVVESARFKGCDFRMPHLEKPQGETEKKTEKKTIS